ncbi:TrkA family potassium uptake protein [Halodesulfurarchaeum sp. HSR-GB]|uniref:potassium channel family protein n=1 Tax=Halodesulfurarchaeum sp. HSR-GB TaxID=3074077 RepID=UPI00286338DC|nr:TrkA family potassium uptake protein [Halodesulfurarchaeum sp. HSR-GB]MDR5657322.1 TrkA family potassium uptake protein [Halodesulfurarchaeum sp. HSR-GB]
MTKTDHVLVAGGGRVGRRVAKRFADRGRPVTVIERDPDEAHETDRDFELVAGDATRPSVIESALRPETETIAALTDREDTNLAVCLVARQIDPDLRTVARIEDECGDEYADFVDQVYFPERASIRAAVNAISGSNVRTLEDVTGDLEILDIQVGYDAPIKGKRISEIEFPEGVQIISQTNGHVAAQPDEKIVAGRRYLVAADNPVVNDVLDLFQGAEE